MLSGDLVKLSLRQIYRNKRRYKSVILGLGLGIAGLVTVLTMGNSVETDLGRNLEVLGTATVIKASWDFDRCTRWHHGHYSRKDLVNLRGMPGVRSVSPVVWRGGLEVMHRGKKLYVTLLGVEESFFETMHLPLAGGRKISRGDVEQRRSVCVVAGSIVDDLLGPAQNPEGKKLFLAGHMFTVVGHTGGVEGRDFHHRIVVPISVARSRFAGLYKIRDIYIRAANWDMVPSIQAQAFSILAANQPGYAESILVRYFPERIRTIKRAVLLVKLFVYASLVVTLLLGGLGITNVMLAAVRERTTEIGLRKAVGATNGMIMSQFLLESTLISLTGAAVGLLAGVISVEALKKTMNIVPQYDVFILSLIGSVIIGLVLGVITGIVPAKRASKLHAVDAMRFE
jgi:putative ABC transport system permease protein